ncbi:MAG: methyltransferase [Gemmatimonadetes bacterium]|nr:methyltransferase [Gemmatimonadota bacterium]
MSRPTPDSRWHHWTTGPFAVAGRAVPVALKPGVPGFATPDIALAMLAEGVADAAAGRVLVLGPGNGLVPAAALAAGATRLWVCDRHVNGAESARRTLAAKEGTGRAAQVITRQAPAPDAPPLDASLVALRIPTDKRLLRQLLWTAARHLAPGGRLLLAGANQEGAKSAAKLVADLFVGVTVEAQHSAHRLLAATRPDTLPDTPPWPELAAEVAPAITVPDGAGGTLTLDTAPGVFSWEHLDEATALLLDTMDLPAGSAVLDLGCGAGALGLMAAHRHGASRVLLLDADAEAVAAVHRTLARHPLPSCEARVSDVAAAAGDEPFDAVVTNPPFHLGKGTDYHLPAQFIAEAAERLRPGGRLFLVANRTLPYEDVITAHFGGVRRLRESPRFKVLGAVRPPAVTDLPR